MSDRWCDRCRAYKPVGHEHAKTLWDVVEEEHEALMLPSLEEPSLEGPGQAHRDDPATSKEAAKLVTARATSARVALLVAHYEHRDGMIDEDAALAAGLSLASEYATRCSELVRIGVLTDTAQTRIGRAGAARMVRRITPLGVLIVETRRLREAG